MDPITRLLRRQLSATRARAIHFPASRVACLIFLLWVNGDRKLAAQTHDIDSLKVVLKHSDPDTARARTLYRLSRAYWTKDLDTAYQYASVLLDLSLSLKFHAGIGNAYNSMGVVEWYKGDYPAAEIQHRKALAARKIDAEPSGIAASYHNLGLLHDDQGNYPEALKYYLDALKLYDSIGNKEGIAQEQSVIGTMHMAHGDMQASIKAHREALSIREELHDEWGLTETYNNLGIAYAELGELDQALAWHQKALDLRLGIGDELGTATSYNNFGYIYLAQGRSDKAMESLQEALRINTALGHRKSMANVELNIGKVYVSLGDHRTAMQHQERSLALAREVGASDYVHMALEDLSNSAAKAGAYAKAYEYRLQFEQLNDSIFNSEKTRSLVRQEMEYGFAKEQLADSLANVEARNLAERDHQMALLAERNRRNLIAFGGVLVLLLSAGLWSRLRYIRRTRDTILRTQRQLVISEKKREAEQVRTRIARDMHDELGSELTKIGMMIGELKNGHAVVPAEKLERIATLSGEANTSLHDIVWAVDPQHDSVRSLILHAQYYTDRLFEGRNIQLEQLFDHEGADRPIDPGTKRNIFLLLKEAVNNALKYSKADHILVSLRTTPHTFHLLVKDNGIGFDLLANRENGNGTRNMRSRCEALGADLHFTTAPGKGCAVEAKGPLP